MTDIATQIRSRLDAIAAERARLDDEELRLKKALDALEPTSPATSEGPGLEDGQQTHVLVACRHMEWVTQADIHRRALFERFETEREERLNRPG